MQVVLLDIQKMDNEQNEGINMTYIIGAVAIAAFTSGFAMALWFSQEKLGKAYRMGKRDGHREVSELR